LGGSPAPPFRAVSAAVSARLCDRCPVRALGWGDGQCPAPWGRPIGAADAWIAATALLQNVPLV